MKWVKTIISAVIAISIIPIIITVANLPKEEEKILTPDFSSGDVVLTPDSGKVLSQVTIVKDNDLVPENIVKDVEIFGVVGTAETSGGGLTGGYNVVYGLYNKNLRGEWWISITLTFIDDTTASYEIKSGGTIPSDWEEQTNYPIDSTGLMDRPYVWNNVKSVSIRAHDVYGSPKLIINGRNAGVAYDNEALYSNILVTHSGGEGSN